jgi:hypothetical protein
MGLLNSTVLDWAIGIIFVYLLLAVVCTTINEWIAGITSVRAKTLEKGIAQLLDKQPTSDTSKTFLDEFYDHPLVSGMFTPGKSGAAGHPSYLPSRTFATALMDLATKGIQGTITFEQLQNGVKTMPSGSVQRALLALIQNSSGDLTRAQKNIEQWYDDSMQRVSGWYKRRTQYVTIAIAVVLTLATNADTIRFGHMLWVNPTLRSAMVEQAKSRTDTGKEAARSETVEYPKGSITPVHTKITNIDEEMKPLKPLLGWSEEDWNDLHDPSKLSSHLLGWILSIIAISLGSPFWFDTLNKLMNIRNAGKKPQTSDNQTDGGNKPIAGSLAVAVEKVDGAK